MFADLQRLEVGQGFICHYPYKHGTKSVAVLLCDNATPQSAQTDILHQLQEHFIRLNGVQVNASDKQSAPVIYELSSDNNYVTAVETAIDASMPKQVMLCDGWDVYVDVCTAMGIKRSDHMRLATQKGWKDPSVSRVQREKAPRSYLTSFLKAHRKCNIGLAGWPNSSPVLDPITDREFKSVLSFSNSFLAQGYRHIHLGEMDISNERSGNSIHIDTPPAEMNLDLPQPRCLFEYNLLIDSSIVNMILLADMVSGDNMNIVRTLRFRRAEKNGPYAVDPTGLCWNLDDYAQSCSKFVWMNLNANWVKEFDSMCMLETKLLYPALDQMNDLGTPILKANHSSTNSILKKAGVRDYYVVRPQIIQPDEEEEVFATQRLRKKKACFTRVVGRALHEVDKFKRRRPNSLPNSEKSVEVKAHIRGHEKFGVSGRIVSFKPPTP